MSKTLKKNHKLRQQWLANIYHELRTPITTLNYEIESLEDGITTLDMNQIISLKQEVQRLQYLIDDLYELSLSEAGGLKYNFSVIDINSCIDQAMTTLINKSKETDIDIVLNKQEGLLKRADHNRITQLFTNLINNSLSYTEAPGKIIITSKKEKNSIKINIEDTKPAPQNNIERLFEPFFRAQKNQAWRTQRRGIGINNLPKYCHRTPRKNYCQTFSIRRIKYYNNAL